MRALIAALVLTAVTSPAFASGIESAGTDMAIALPLIAGGISLYKDDRTGFAQLTIDTVATVGTAYALKQFVRERRPDKSDFESFPSDTAALAFAPAQYLWDRYGWEYGLPAYAAAGFVGYSRIDAKKHHWYDVAASAGFAFTFSKLFTTRYRAPGLRYGASVAPDGGYIRLAYDF
ncbi:MAG TPA: phosphatase PAP2 family protein [Rhizomicrobium sp.]